MVYYVDYIKDVIENNYLGINIDPNIIKPFLRKLEEVLKDDCEEYISYQQKRDRGSYHITVINVSEYNALVKEHGMDTFVNSLESILKYEIDDLKMLGIGKASKNGNVAYYIVCQSDKLDAVRGRYNLKSKDFHITIGFKYKDVFGVPKDKVMDIKDPFLFELKERYLRNENWNFIRKLTNFDLDKNAEIVPIEIMDNKAKFRINNYYIVISYINDDLRISNKFNIDKDLPRLSQRAILKKINEI